MEKETRPLLLVKKMPSLAIRSRRTGGVWNKGEKEIWCDPTSRTVQDYNIDLACEIAAKGVDEIQFDYIRFPTGADQKDAAFAFDFGAMNRDQAVTWTAIARALPRGADGNEKDVRAIAAFLITLYQRLLSPLFPPSCRFVPTCSQYAKEAILKFGIARGSYLAARRILRCHPFHAGGYDPVP